MALGANDRLQLLLEFSEALPPLPERFADAPEKFLERVEECQSPVFITTEVDDFEKVHIYASAPAEAPTSRGFASLIIEGTKGMTAREVLELPAEIPYELGLTNLISPLRIRGMVGLLARVKRQTSVLLQTRGQ